MTDYAAHCGLPERTPTQTLIQTREALSGLLKRCELPQDADVVDRLTARLAECDEALKAENRRTP